MSGSIVALAALVASFAAVILSMSFALLAWRRFVAMQTQLDGVSRAIGQLERAHSSLLIRSMNSPKPRSRKAPKGSSPSSGTVQETSLVAREQVDEGNSNEPVLDVVAPKPSPE